jgi:hypothetical protein
MLAYEKMRGIKGEIKSELQRLRGIDLKTRMDNEEDIRNIEAKIMTEEDQKYSNTLSAVRFANQSLNFSKISNLKAIFSSN